VGSAKDARIAADFRTISSDMTAASPSTATAYRSWMCVVCGFIYNEKDGLPDEGIAPGTRWADIPDTWTCPDCGVTKDDFEMVEV
jgi:rubredoxin